MKKYKLKKTIPMIILVINLFNCKTQLQPTDCENNHRINLLQACDKSQPDLNFCILEYVSYYDCKKENSKKLFNNLEF